MGKMMEYLGQECKEDLAAAAEKVQDLELKRDEKEAQLAQARGELQEFHRQAASGKSDAKKLRALIRKVFFLEEEVKGIGIVLDETKKAAENMVAHEVELVKKKITALDRKAREEREKLHREILEACKQLWILIYKNSGMRARGLSERKSMSIELPALCISHDELVSMRDELRDHCSSIKSGCPYTTEREKGRLESWVRRVSPRDLVDEVVANSGCLQK